MTRNELKRYNGKNGQRVYTAYKGKVYDVTESPFWKEGEHEGLHVAGEDLTEVLQDAPHGEEVFKQFDIVGELEQEKSHENEEQQPTKALGRKARMQAWYRTYHPHPLTIHFPIALHLFAAGLDLLFFANPSEVYAVGVFYSFFVATIGGLVAMIPGIFSWWVNYSFAMSRALVVKLVLSTMTLVLGIVAIVIYYQNPDVVYGKSLQSLIYHGIVLITGLTVIVIAYYGGKLAWPDRSNGGDPAARRRAEAEELEAEASSYIYHKPFAFGSDASSAPVTLPRSEAQVCEGSGRSLSILIGGAAGTGIQTLEKLLSDAFKEAGYYLFSTKEYMSRVRGGSNTTLIRISDRPLEAACWQVDMFIAIDAAALSHAEERCGEQTLMLADEAVAAMDKRVMALPMKKEAMELGNINFANSYAAGVIFGVLGLEPEFLEQCVLKHFAERSANENVSAAKSGVTHGRKLDASMLPQIPEPAKENTASLHLMNGTTAAGFGFMAGGCNFVASYPMSPSTGVLTFMASMSKEFEVVVEQCEDEIAGLNMVLGAWYAGARAMTTTSGGGFALMTEALSLSGVSETPAVIYLAQRPGPATGMPTRTEQGDLNLVLFAGHGEVGRVILAPGSLQECIDCGYLAFELADRYQIPVIVLSDQFLADSITMINAVDFAAYEQRRYMISTDVAYNRYVVTESGISPRGAPGLGEGLIIADSHEHDERGQVSEDFRVREQMLDKRARKMEAVKAEALPPQIEGSGEIAVVGWGSTRGAIREAIFRLKDPRLFQVHFAWVHPLSSGELERLSSAKRVLVVENNTTGQFADRLEMMGITVDRRILQANGFAFFADQLTVKIESTLKEMS